MTSAKQKRAPEESHVAHAALKMDRATSQSTEAGYSLGKSRKLLFPSASKKNVALPSLELRETNFRLELSELHDHQCMLFKAPWVCTTFLR